MVRFLKFFTVVGDDQEAVSKWHDELNFSEDLEPPNLTTSQLTFRDGLKRLFSSERFQIAVVILVILDALFVLCELLLDLSIIEVDEHHIAPEVFHYLSLALLTFFMVELGFKLYAFQLEFFHHKFEVFDGIVVILSFILDIVYISKENAFDGMGLLILLRLWRVARIINGILLSVKSQADHKVHKLKAENDRLLHQISELQEHKTAMEQEVKGLRAILTKHSIQY
ncbi:voltage-gated hydrogen channel 1 [Tachysurus fulvidraco]|uniref:voltage-gated hydrogen channel 1 n=1 Tax=Tachysurus fulvidraco TaxID=1234273 RepID=UPI000F4F7EEC|nr:voltage-gated hydrogen channel 1 [Tachysurus fulvidraco]XP_027031193.1 voltage-gated hydrogen channel 1 [Tachysurus fulvidraco]XP_027031194.1 voltage-gated hydrogen channel 1 [Tachysurus fulvidraco]XP_047660941.1 voltage-gated hydrogen channel 1 [Tachysurus fulvidraco]XP_047660943.1 voltage-gated hydrogen channel 1 [Tachysurus fulvidraco]